MIAGEHRSSSKQSSAKLASKIEKITRHVRMTSSWQFVNNYSTVSYIYWFYVQITSKGFTFVYFCEYTECISSILGILKKFEIIIHTHYRDMT